MKLLLSVDTLDAIVLLKAPLLAAAVLLAEGTLAFACAIALFIADDMFGGYIAGQARAARCHRVAR